MNETLKLKSQIFLTKDHLLSENDAPMNIKITANDTEYTSNKDGMNEKYKNYNASTIKNEFLKKILEIDPFINEIRLETALDNIIPMGIDFKPPQMNEIDLVDMYLSREDIEVKEFMENKFNEGYRFNEDGKLTQTPDDLKNQSQSQTLK